MTDSNPRLYFGKTSLFDYFKTSNQYSESYDKRFPVLSPRFRSISEYKNAITTNPDLFAASPLNRPCTETCYMSEGRTFGFLNSKVTEEQFKVSSMRYQTNNSLLDVEKIAGKSKLILTSIGKSSEKPAENIDFEDNTTHSHIDISFRINKILKEDGI